MPHADLFAHFDKHDITLIIHKKAVKNVNFRLTFISSRTCFSVSVPRHLSDNDIHHLIMSKSAWAMAHAHKRKHTHTDQSPTHAHPKLWGEPFDVADYLTQHPIKLSKQQRQDLHACRLAIYEHELKVRLPALADTWQPVVGRFADEIRTKKMHTRWGSCNTHEARIWLSTYLPAYPYPCTEYVFVHELCHLIHPNHSPAFWHEVKKAMPDYQTWYNLLKDKP